MPFKAHTVSVHAAFVERYTALAEAARKGRRPEAAIWRSAQTAIARIKRDATWGEVIPKGSIPRHFAQRFDALNLYCVDLAGFHRLFYTIRGREVAILDIVDHAQYDKWFPSKGK